MRNIFTSRQLWLQPGEVASFRATQPSRLQIACGRVWITMEGKSTDYWLCGGQSVDVAGQGLVVIEGVGGISKLEVRTARRDGAARVAGTFSRLIKRLHSRREAGIIEGSANCSG